MAPTGFPGFEEWHRRECPALRYEGGLPCLEITATWLSDRGVARDTRFANRTCREVYEMEREASSTVALDGSTKRECPTCGGEMPEDRARELHQKEQALANSAKTSQSAEEAARGALDWLSRMGKLSVMDRIAGLGRGEPSDVEYLTRLLLSREAAVREECAALVEDKDGVYRWKATGTIAAAIRAGGR